MHTFAYQDLTLTWEEHSPGDELFIFVPGHGNVRQMWTHMLGDLAPLGRWISLDLVGHYPATIAPGAYQQLSPTDLAAIYSAAVRHICGDQPVTLAGHSTGGMVALLTAARLPQVRRVISLSSVLWGPLSGLPGLLQWAMRHRLGFLLPPLFDLFRLSPHLLVFGAMFYAHRWLHFLRDPLVWHIYRSSYLWFRQHRLENLVLLLKMLDSCDIRPQIANLSVPVLACTGAHDPVVRPAQSRWLAAHLPHADLWVIAGAGHPLYVEAPQQVVQAMTEWVQAHPLP